MNLSNLVKFLDYMALLLLDYISMYHMVQIKKKKKVFARILTLNPTISLLFHFWKLFGYQFTLISSPNECNCFVGELHQEALID